ncbi:MAG: FAD-dependent oxidoreductase, partial [Pseudomonadota bacterium]
MRRSKHKIAVVGAGIGGLSAAMRLAAAGASVTVFERADWCGGKLRAVPSEAGAVDAGPTVLTQRHVFDELFEATGASLDDYATLVPEPLLARHYWVDGSQLDLFGDTDESCAAIRDFAGAQEAAAFRRFTARCQRLFRQFETPVMRSGQPSLATLTATVLRNPKVLADLRPTRSLARDLAAEFRDPRLRQLFGRYATYVGGSPYRVPALLGLIWSSEQAGVWRVEGGMHALAAALAQRADEVGVDIRLGTGIARIEGQNGHLTGLTTEDGT